MDQLKNRRLSVVLGIATLKSSPLRTVVGRLSDQLFAFGRADALYRRRRRLFRAPDRGYLRRPGGAFRSRFRHLSFLRSTRISPAQPGTQRGYRFISFSQCRSNAEVVRVFYQLRTAPSLLSIGIASKFMSAAGR